MINIKLNKINIALACITLLFAVAASGVFINYNSVSNSKAASNFLNSAEGDINDNGIVDISDLSILLSKWNTNYTLADLNNSGKVDVVDLSILLSNWNKVIKIEQPNSSNTGVPTNIVLSSDGLPNCSDGYIQVRTDNYVIDSKEINCSVYVFSKDVIIKNNLDFELNVSEYNLVLLKDAIYQHM